MNAVDLSILQALTRLRPGFDALMQNLAGNDLVKGALLVCGLCWFWWRAHPEQARRRELVVACIAGAFVAAALSRSLTLVDFGRERPFRIAELNLPEPFHTTWEDKSGSFPSDHAALAFGLVTGLFLISRPMGWSAAAYVLVFVCLPRVYLGIHWPSDIVGGVVIGVATTAVLSRPRLRAAVAAPALRLQSRSPELFHVAAFVVLYGLMTRLDDARSLAHLALTQLHGDG